MFSNRKEIARIKGFPYYGSMNITLSLDDNLVKEVRKIAVEGDTTLTGMVRAYLEQVASEHGTERRRKDLERLNKTLDRLQTKLDYGNRTWKREDLYSRKSR